MHSSVSNQVVPPPQQPFKKIKLDTYPHHERYQFIVTRTANKTPEHKQDQNVVNTRKKDLSRASVWESSSLSQSCRLKQRSFINKPLFSPEACGCLVVEGAAAAAAAVTGIQK